MSSKNPVEKAVPVTRKLFFAAAGWILGLMLFFCFGKTGFILLFIAEALTSAIFLFSVNKYSRFALLAAVFAMLGAIFFSVYKHLVYERIIAFDGREVIVEGTVADYEYTSGSVRLTVKGRLNGGVKATVSLYCGDADIDYYDRVSVRFNAAVPQNTASFAAEDYNTSRGIFLEGSGTAAVIENKGCVNYPLRMIKRSRSKTISKIYAICPGQSGAFLASMLCSEKSRLNGDTKNAVYRAGLGHIFAVSGTHIVMIFSFVQLIASKITSSKKLRSIAALVVIWLFALFAGLSPSVVRACIMMSINCVGELFDRRGDAANSLGAAAIIITLGCPYLITSVSFVMSFTAAFAIGVIAPAVCRDRISDRMLRTVVSYICISVCSAPFCAVFFSEISLISVVTNILLIPICTAALALSFIFIITGFELTLAIRAAGALCEIVINICEAVTRLPFTYIGTYRWRTLALCGAYGALVLIFCALSKNRKSFGIAKFIAVYLLLCVVCTLASRFPEKDKIIIFPDSYGYSAIIVSDAAAYVFDVDSSARSRYALARIAEQYHVSDSYIFIRNNTLYSSIRYKNEFGSGAHFFSGSCDIPERGITAFSAAEFANAEVICENDDFLFYAGELSVEFYEDSFRANGREYLIEGFSGAVEFSADFSGYTR